MNKVYIIQCGDEFISVITIFGTTEIRNVSYIYDATFWDTEEAVYLFMCRNRDFFCKRYTEFYEIKTIVVAHSNKK